MSLNYKVRKNDKIVIFGHKGLIGSAIVRELQKRSYKKIITATKRKLNLLNPLKVQNFFKKVKPDVVIIAAARVGGIYANNNYPFNFLYENMVIQNNIIGTSIRFSCRKLIFLGSSCIYPKLWNKPFSEKDLNMANLEKTNEPYAIAKISGLKLCETFNRQFNNSLPKFITIIPPNLFGPNDNYDRKNSHVLAALIRKFYISKKHNLKKVEIWGSGKPKREFLYSENAASIIVDIMETSEKIIFRHTRGKYSHINIGLGIDFKISEIVEKLIKISKFKGKIFYNKNYPDGVKRKLLDIRLLKKISPRSFNRVKKHIEKFDKDLKKEYKSITIKTLKKFEKDSTYNLPI
tara:strand:- start:894 stop:1937 length:1044 start_codon:yes stop_codon:yes gene_type:complete